MYQATTNSGLALLGERTARNAAAVAPLQVEQETSRPVISLGSVLRKRYLYLLFCLAASAGIAAYVADRFAQGVWTYTSELLHQPLSSEASAGLPPLDHNTLRVVVKSQQMLDQLKDEFSLNTPVAVLDKCFEVEVPYGGKAIVTKLTWGDPQQAEAMLNRFNDLFSEKLDRLRHERLEQLGRGFADEADRAQREQSDAQDALAKLCDSVNVLDWEKDLSALRGQISDLQSDVRKLRGAQSAMVAQKTKGFNLAGSLMANQMEICMIEGLLLARREEEQQIKSVRRQILELNNRVSAAALHRQRVEELGDSNRQLQNSEFHEVSVVQPARPALVPYVSNYKKLLAGAFVVAGLVLVAPVAFLEVLALKEPAVNATARLLGLPVLAARPGERPTSRVWQATDQNASEDFARLLSLRVQQCVLKPGYVLLFSCMDRCPSPVSLLGNLARCFSERDHRVLLVDVGADQRSHAVLKELLADGGRNYAAHQGLAEFLAFKETSLEQVTVPTMIPEVDCLLPGNLPLPREALGTRRFSELFEQLREQYTLIIVVGPGAHQAVDLEMLAARADGIVFHTSRPHNVDAPAARVVRHLINLDAPILGVIG